MFTWPKNPKCDEGFLEADQIMLETPILFLTFWCSVQLCGGFAASREQCVIGTSRAATRRATLQDCMPLERFRHICSSFFDESFVPTQYELRAWHAP
jgi:hypothetical protein